MEFLIRNKKTLLIAGALVLVLAVAGSSIFAYLASTDKSVATFTVGNNTSEIIETWDKPDELKPGESYTKNVAVKNTGTIDCYVRVLAEIDDPEVAEMISVDYNTNMWTKNGDYWYYLEPLAPGETTESLFTTLTVTEFVNKPIEGDYFSMIVYSETTQKGKAGSWGEAFGVK